MSRGIVFPFKDDKSVDKATFSAYLALCIRNSNGKARLRLF